MAAPPSTTPPAEPGGFVTGGTTTCDYQPQEEPGPKPGLPPQPTGALPTRATITLGQGTISIALDAKATCTVNSWAFLAGKSYFDNTSCHRLTTESIFVLQCGDPTGTGGGGPGYTMAEENLPPPDDTGGTVYRKAVVAMAKATPPHTTGSQFFLVYDDSPLDPDYTLVGTITGGMDVLTAIAAQGTDDGSTDGAPKEPVQIASLTVA